MITQTKDLIRVIIDYISPIVYIKTITEDSPGVYIIESCNTLWVTIGYTITINGNDYVVTDIMPNEWIKVTGTVLPNATEFSLYQPFFWYGTVLATQRTLLQIPSNNQKYPCIWLHEITKEHFEKNKLRMLDRTSDCDLYFLVDADPTMWETPDHDRYAIKPMRNLVEKFILALNDANVKENFSYDIFDHANFGVYLESKGHTKMLFADKLSGTQLRITIPFLKNNSTCVNCD